jgi:hypothetical protein
VKYLETERNNDGVVTLWVEQTLLGIGSILVGGANPGLINGVCGSGAVGGYLIGPPVLQLADQSQPLAVTMSTFRAVDPAVNWPLTVGLGALAAIVVGGLAVSRRRAARG